MESFVQPFKSGRHLDNDHNIGEKLRKLVTRNFFKIGLEENQQSVLRGVKKHAKLGKYRENCTLQLLDINRNDRFN